MKNIENDPELHTEFIRRLNKIKNKDRYEKEDVEYIIEKVKGLQDFYYSELEEVKEAKNIDQFKQDLDYFFDKFFSKYEDPVKLFEHLEYHNKDFVYSNKILQLYHMRRMLHTQRDSDNHLIGIHDDLLNNLKLMLFLNYFELFPRYIEPIFFDGMIGSKNYNYTMNKKGVPKARIWYNSLSMLTHEIIDYETIQGRLFNLRNKLAHSESFVEGGKFIYLKFPENKEDKESFKEKNIKYLPTKKDIFKELETIDVFQKLVIIISTDFDLRILRLYNKINEVSDEAFRAWKKYVDNYINYWLIIGDKVHVTP